MEKMKIENPYAPSSWVPAVPTKELSDSSLVRYLVSTFWFLPGTIAGLELGHCFQFGLESWISKTKSMTLQSAIYLTVFACACLIISMFWRLPRRYFGGHRRVHKVASFGSGLLMVLSARLVVFVGVESGLLSMTQWVHFGILLVFGILSVECEDIVNRLVYSPKQHADRGQASQN
jgi:hypothetical protein